MTEDTATEYEASVWYNGDYKYAYRDPAVLRGLYVDRELSQINCGELLGCSGPTVGRYMEKNDIDARGNYEMAHRMKKEELYSMSTNERGYEDFCVSGRYQGERVSVHRLLAIAEYGFKTVAENVIHHKNGIPWDNRIENIELMSEIEHNRLTNEIAHDKDSTPWRQKQWLEEKYIVEDRSQKEVSQLTDCNEATVRYWVNKHGIQKDKYEN